MCLVKKIGFDSGARNSTKKEIKNKAKKLNLLKMLKKQCPQKRNNSLTILE